MRRSGAFIPISAARDDDQAARCPRWGRRLHRVRRVCTLYSDRLRDLAATDVVPDWTTTPSGGTQFALVDPDAGTSARRRRLLRKPRFE